MLTLYQYKNKTNQHKWKMLQWDLWRGLPWYQHWKLQVSSRCFQFAASLCSLSGCRLQLVCTFPYSQHYSCSIFKADREMHLQSLNAAVPACWITWCCYQRAGEETQTHTPQLQSNRMKTPMHARTRPCTNILVLRNPVEKINTLSPELHTVMRSSAISQRFHQKGSYKYSV